MDPTVVKRWLPALGRNPHAALRLFCLPHAGGTASAFHAWGPGLASWIETCPVQLPGREGRLDEPCFGRMQALIEPLRQVIAAAMDKPFAIFGHSMGALIAFELVQALRGSAAPVRLFVSGHPAPHLRQSQSPLHTLSDDLFLAEVERRYDAIPPAVKMDSELLGMVLPIMRSDFALVETYTHKHRPPLECPISVFGGESDESVGRDALEAWSVHTRAPSRLRILPGGHFFVQSARDRLLRGILDDLDSMSAGWRDAR